MSFSAIILGRRRQGKSTLALNVAAARSESIVVVDPNWQYRNFPACPIDPSTIVSGLENQNGCLLVLHPDPARIMDEWALIASVLWDYEDYSLLIDEASMIQHAGWCDSWLERYLRQAPDSVSLIQTTHRAVDLCKLSRSLATDLFLFRTTLEADLSLLGSEFPGLKIPAVRTLPVYNVLHYWTERGGYERNNLWDKPGEWNINIGRFGGRDGSGAGTAASGDNGNRQTVERFAYA